MKKQLLSLSLALLLLFSTSCTKPFSNPADSGTDAETTTEAETATQVSETGISGIEDETDKMLDPFTDPTAYRTTTELSVSPYLSEEGTHTREVTWTLSEQDSTYYALHEATVSGSTVTLKKQTVSALHFNRSYDDETVVRYQCMFWIDGNRTGAGSPWNTLYIGMRLPTGSTWGDQTQSGVWLSIHHNEVGLRVGAWPTTEHISLPDGVDFSTERQLIIEDDMITDTITLSAETDGGDIVVIATVRIEDGSINLYAPGTSTPAISDPLEEDKVIAGTGCVNFWMHGTAGDATIRDLMVTGTETVKSDGLSANMLHSLDVLSDTWVSTDDVGRIAGTDNRTVTDKKVGIFYFLWHSVETHGGDGKIYNHSESWYTGGRDAFIQTMTEGPMGFAHYWAEPYFGYYRSVDEWVIRKHAYQLTAAGIDFVFFDVSNGLSYETEYETVLRIWSEMRAEGYDTPQVMFFVGMTEDKTAFDDLWRNLYSVGRYEELWFKHDSKPLILVRNSIQSELTEEQKDFFTFRQSHANSRDSWYTSSRRGANCWPWADLYPQGGGLSPKRKLEQMVVMSGFWANGSFGTNAGRSYCKATGGQPRNVEKGDFGFGLVDQGISGLGLAFEEQFEYAIEQDPGIVMLIGWNEWWAGRWEADIAIGQTIANTYTVTDNDDWTRHYYVDTFNPEFSRDIEPVKGLYNDNYYYQMVQNIRQYKGSRQNLAAFGQRRIDLSGSVGQWYEVGPEYRDYAGDTAYRDEMSYVGNIHYTNTTGRNDFTVAKVAKYSNEVVFYAECAADITAPEGTNWMNLYIDTDCDRETGWYGYDYVINRMQSGNTCSIHKFTKGDWSMEEIGTAEYTVNGNYIQIKVDATRLGLGDTFDFKWADNSVDDGDIMQFIDLGDTAPNDRFNYRYTTIETEVAIPEMLNNDMVVLKAGSYYAFACGEMVRLDESSTKATFFGDEEHLYIPKAFAEGMLKLSVDGESYDHFGVEYVDIKAALENSGKTICTAEGILVIADQTISEEDMLLLYRALY